VDAATGAIAKTGVTVGRAATAPAVRVAREALEAPEELVVRVVPAAGGTVAMADVVDRARDTAATAGATVPARPPALLEVATTAANGAVHPDPLVLRPRPSRSPSG